MVRIARWPWLPLPLLLGAVIVLAIADVRTVYESEILLTVCNFAFSTVASALVVILVGRSYLARPSPVLLLFGCGVLIWGAAGTLVPVLFPYGTNALIGGHNTLVWLSAMCHLAGVLLSLRPSRVPQRPLPTLGAAYAGAAGLVWIVTTVAVKGHMPLFFVQDQGGTPLRSVVLVSAVAMFAFTAMVLWRAHRPSPAAFARWYALALSLVATGLLGVLLEPAHGCALSWTGRAAQFLGGAYMLVAAAAAVRETGAWHVSRELARWDRRWSVWDDQLLRLLTPQRLLAVPPIWRYVLALVMVAGATVLRRSLIPWMGTTAPYNLQHLAILGTVVLLGMGPGLLVTVVGDIAVELFVVGSLATFVEPVTMFRLGVSTGVGIVLCWVLHAARTAAAKSRQSEERLAAFASATFEGIVESDAGRILDCNEQFARMTGYTAAELKGVAIADLVAPEDRERVTANIAGNRESVVEHAVLRKDGARIIVEAHGRPAASGSAGRYTAVRDVTARKQVEGALLQVNEHLERRVAEQTADIRKGYDIVQTERQRLYNVLEALPVYVVLLSRDYHVPFANKFFRERFGESVGKRCFEYLFNRTEACENCESFKALKTGAPHHWEWTGPDGRDYDIHDFPFTDADGTPMIMEMGIDITEMKKAQTAFKELNATLERRVAERTADLAQANAELQQFNQAMVGRELRMIELKKEINAMLVGAGLPAKYEVGEEGSH